MSIDEISQKIITKEEFFKKIDYIVNSKCMSYFDAILAFCAETNLDYQEVPKLISKPLKAILEKEAHDFNLLKKSANKITIF